MYDCYIASGWFNENQARDLENIKSTLDELGVKYFSPKDEIVAKPDASKEEQELIFKGNVDAITSGKFVVCNTRDKDLGTIFEAGFSYASGVPIVYYAEGLTGNFNLMLSRSGRAVATSVDELKEHVKGIMDNPEYEKEYVGFVE
jgi:nucleoside 2-deoxyribosyltransferase